jgi:hypothetical protein
MEREPQHAPLVVAVVFSEPPDDARLRVEGAHPCANIARPLGCNLRLHADLRDRVVFNRHVRIDTMR